MFKRVNSSDQNRIPAPLDSILVIEIQLIYSNEARNEITLNSAVENYENLLLVEILRRNTKYVSI